MSCLRQKRRSCAGLFSPSVWLLLVIVAAVLCAAPFSARALASEVSLDLATSTDAPSSHNNATSESAFVVFGYLPEYRQLRFDYEAFFKAGLTHLIFFSAEVDPTSLQLIHVEDRLPSMDKWRTIRTLADKYDVKLMLCIGGGGRSAGFPLLVHDVVGRRRFISQVQRVVQQRELDGVDFNWEYPDSMTEWLSFGQFLAELRPALRHTAAGAAAVRHRRDIVRSALITMALHPHPSVANVLRSSRVLPSLDYLHWMAYDHIVPGEGHSSVAYATAVLQDDMIGSLDDAVHNARLAQLREGSKTRSTAAESAAAANTTVARKPNEVDHRRKLCLGIPFYGRHREDRRLPPESYEHLWQFIKQWARKRQPTWQEGGPELRAMSNYAGYDYNGYDDVKRKMRLARSAGVAGIMIWELGQDVPPGTSPMSLMTAIHEQLAAWQKRKATGKDETWNASVSQAGVTHRKEEATQLPRTSTTPRRPVVQQAGRQAAKEDATLDGDL